jgi:tetratricopeptide (TPR) repeat protein
MKQEINYSRYADRYLDGVMSAEEELWFTKELDGNLELQEELKLHKKINKAISDYDAIDLEAQLDNIYNENYKPLKKSIHISKRSGKVVFGASAVLIVMALLTTGITYLVNRSVSTDEIIAAYYQPAEMNMSFRAAEDVVDSDLRTAMLYYENHDYEKAIALFERILKDDDSRIGLNLYSGISHMEIEQYAAANENFQRIIDHKANAFIESAEWYLGLCYLMTEEEQKATEIFTRIASQDGYYEKEAKKILKKMR